MTQRARVRTRDGVWLVMHASALEGSDTLAVIIEPALYSAGCIVVDKEYLQAARDLCTRHGAVLIFDEIMSGFRNGLGGAGARMGVIADLGAFGKAVANGHIMAVLAGKAELMKMLAPEGPVFYSGTYNGHPQPAGPPPGGVAAARDIRRDRRRS